MRAASILSRNNNDQLLPRAVRTTRSPVFYFPNQDLKNPEDPMSIALSMSTLVGTCLLLAVPPTALAQTCGHTTPPFTQAPPIGADTSAAILLLIDQNGGLIVKSDPTQGPYDGIEDTLIAVQNNSSNSIAAIPLTGTQPIFAFDGDGICAVTPHPAGCPFGSTGYEGPGVSFSNISADRRFGIVNFAPAIPPGGCRYFGLEEAIQTQCPAITSPQLLHQGDPAWANIHLGNSANTIGTYGCYITSAAMLINYHAAQQGSSFRTDPPTLNQWLTAHNFYTAMGAVFPLGVPFAQYARANNVNLYYYGSVDHRDDFTLDQYLCHAQPPLLYVLQPHWVLPTGQTVFGTLDTYSVLDPDSYPNGNTLHGFNDTYLGLDLYSDVFGPLAGLYISAHSPVELLLMAPNGDQTGFDPANNVHYNSIGQSGYMALSFANDQDHGLPGTPADKYISVVSPANGTYMLVVAGVGTGPYTLDFAAFDVNGNQSNASFAGTVVPGSHFVYQITYSSAAGAQLIVQPPPDTTPPSIAVSASPSVLWPPNNKLVPVTIAGAIVDTGTGVNPSSARYAVVDEYGVVQPSGPVSLDSSGNYSFVIQLMASRFGYDSDGRHYTITISAADYAHNLGAASAVVVVPHNM